MSAPARASIGDQGLSPVVLFYKKRGVAELVKEDNRAVKMTRLPVITSTRTRCDGVERGGLELGEPVTVAAVAAY